MRTGGMKTVVALVIAILGVAGFAYAVTPPALVLSDGTNTVTIDSTGTVTLNCTPTTACSTTNVYVVPGSITWQGQIGVFAVGNVVGNTKPHLPSPEIDLLIQALRTSAFGAGTKALTVTWTDVGFDGTGPSTMNESGSFTFGSGSAVYTSYIDNGNVPSGTGTTVGTLALPPSGAQILTGPGPSNEPFSMTNVATVTMAQSSYFGVDFGLKASPPPPLSLACSTGSADENVLYSSYLRANGGVPPYTFSIIPAGALPNGLTLGASTGMISGTPVAPGTFNFSAQVVDSSGNSSTNTVTQACTMTVNGPLSVICAAVNTGDVGVPFDSGPMTVMGGTAPYTYSIVGTLPPGLTLNTSTGEVTGTPTAAGTFTVEVTDAVGNSSTSCLITISAGPALTCAATGTTGEVGASFTSTPPTVSGGTAPYTFSVVGTLPGGLTLNTSTGVVTGTPTATGSFNLQVTDSNGVSTTTSCPYTIGAGPALTCAATGTTGEVGVAFSSPALTVSGGTAPYTFSVVGTLPVGLTLNTSTGAVVGTPTAAGAFSIQVKDAKGVVAATSCSYTIVTPPPPPVPGISITKKANNGNVCPNQSVTYSYTVTNTGQLPLSNVKVVDNNGTDYTGDDFTVGNIASLAVGASQTLTANVIPPAAYCSNVNGKSTKMGTLISRVLPTGDVMVTYRQEPSVTDNTYGWNANGEWLQNWGSGGRSLSDIAANDAAEFVFLDSGGNAVLDFAIDYISQSSSFPSGYGTLGFQGGNGGLYLGNGSYILGYDTTLSSNLNQKQFQSGYTWSSPAQPNSSWDYGHGYTVVVSKNAFGSKGFGGCFIATAHHKKSQYPGQCENYHPTPCPTSSTNTVTVTATATSGATVTATATATVQIGQQYCQPGCTCGYKAGCGSGSGWSTGGGQQCWCKQPSGPQGCSSSDKWNGPGWQQTGWGSNGWGSQTGW